MFTNLMEFKIIVYEFTFINYIHAWVCPIGINHDFYKLGTTIEVVA